MLCLYARSGVHAVGACDVGIGRVREHYPDACWVGVGDKERVWVATFSGVHTHFLHVARCVWE